MGNWVFCRRCDPTMTIGGTPNPAFQLGRIGGARVGETLLGDLAIPNECETCAILIVQPVFANTDIQDQVIDGGTFTPGDAWVLFNDGDDFTRDSSGGRDIAVSITTFENPADATTDLIESITVGDFTWTRKSTDPLDGADFSLFTLTAGTFDPECECGHCVGFIIYMDHIALALPYPPNDFSVAFELEQWDECCDEIPSSICLKWVPAEIPLDGWIFGGKWVYQLTYMDGDTPCDVQAVLSISEHIDDSCEDTYGVLTIGAHCWCAGEFVWEDDCSREDPRVVPTVDEFGDDVSANGFPCEDSEATLTALTYGDTCEDDPTDCSCPDDCPVQCVKWQWNVDTQSWGMIESNCIDPAVPPDPPPDPAITDFPWVKCTCCVTVVPECDPGVPPCPGDHCAVKWNGASWSTFLNCSGLGCTCTPPARDGLFLNEAVDGICCNTGE